MKLTYYVLFSFLVSSGCASAMPNKDINLGAQLIDDCISGPHCVSSVSKEKKYYIEPIQFKGSVEEFQAKVKSAVESFPRTEIVQSEGQYFRAEFTTSIMRYTDDVEFFFVPQDSQILVRSSSRVGYYDMGTNRSRVNALREKITK